MTKQLNHSKKKRQLQQAYPLIDSWCNEEGFPGQDEQK